MSDLPELTIDREFDAPRELVWRAWTDPGLIGRWYGPNIETVVHQFDLTPGGIWLHEMQMGGGSSFQKALFKEIIESEKLVWHHYASVDSEGNEVDNPMMENWPSVLLTTVTFEDIDGKTNVRLQQVPQNASDDEIAGFAQMKDGMSGGWGKGYAIIDEILVELKTR